MQPSGRPASPLRQPHRHRSDASLKWCLRYRTVSRTQWPLAVREPRNRRQGPLVNNQVMVDAQATVHSLQRENRPHCASLRRIDAVIRIAWELSSVDDFAFSQLNAAYAA